METVEKAPSYGGCQPGMTGDEEVELSIDEQHLLGMRQGFTDANGWEKRYQRMLMTQRAAERLGRAQYLDETVASCRAQARRADEEFEKLAGLPSGGAGLMRKLAGVYGDWDVDLREFEKLLTATRTVAGGEESWGGSRLSCAVEAPESQTETGSA